MLGRGLPLTRVFKEVHFGRAVQPQVVDIVPLQRLERAIAGELATIVVAGVLLVLGEVLGLGGVGPGLDGVRRQIIRSPPEVRVVLPHFLVVVGLLGEQSVLG